MARPRPPRSHIVARATAPTLFSVGLMDPICPPATVYAAYTAYTGERDIRVWRYADQGGYGSTPPEHLAWLRDRGLAAGTGS
jgi:cephalosporin-C deacetylase